MLEWTTSYFESRGVESPRPSAEILLAHVLNLERVDLYARYDQPLLQAELARFKDLIKRRVQREPVAYILGTKGFWSLELTVTRDVLIPRPETECLVEAALDILESEGPDSGKRVLDLGTGSGAIILSLASRYPQHRFYASDVSLKALGVARKNAVSAGLDRRIHFFCGSWLQALRSDHSSFDLLVSNPPYVCRKDLERLQPEISRYEPLLSLDGGADGLNSIREIIATAHRFLKEGGHLLMEIGHDQGQTVAALVRAGGHYRDVRIEKDYGGLDRIACIQKNLAEP